MSAVWRRGPTDTRQVFLGHAALDQVSPDVVSTGQVSFGVSHLPSDVCPVFCGANVAW